MYLIQQCLNFINSPYPLWDVSLTAALEKNKCRELDIVPGQYSTTNIWHRKNLVSANSEIIANIQYAPIILEQADLLYLKDFYEENGLDVMNKDDIANSNAERKLRNALNLLNTILECGASIAILVKAIQVLRQPEPEFDISYSHPNLPFTIFVSVDYEDTAVHSIRLAESILHEAMHLKLTLIDEQIPIIVPGGSTETFYSPWRLEQRPLYGVLHGLWVFRHILEFYREIIQRPIGPIAKDFVDFRIETIMTDLYALRELTHAKGFTSEGRILATKLLLD